MKWLSTVILIIFLGTFLAIATGCETSHTTVIERGTITETEMLVE